MFILLIWFLFEVQSSNAQFPSHIDFQKIDDIDLYGNTYKLLKPTKHTITDYFKRFMLGQIRRYPNEKVYVDDNGFRHDWTNIDLNLRKHYIVQKATTLKEIKLNDFKGEVVDNNQTKVEKMRKKPRRKKKLVEEVMVPLKETSLREGGRTVARTTFFCPFFGVITMSSYLD